MSKSDDPLSLVSTTDSQCANAGSGVCVPTDVVNTVAQFVFATAPEDERPRVGTAIKAAAATIAAAARVLGCETELCVVTHPKVVDYIDATATRADRAEYIQNVKAAFKPAGPRDTTALLSNFNIEDVLQRWAAEFPEFYNCPFSMMDFEQEKEYLFGTVSLPAVRRGEVPQVVFSGEPTTTTRKCTTFACVLNTDRSSGAGKHWVCVFVDMRKRPWTVEYFNSAGNPPPPPVTRWMEKTAAALRGASGAVEVETVAVSDLCHQKGKTECGVYVLYYIRARLEGVPYGHYEKEVVSDAAMAEFREHLFSGGGPRGFFAPP